MKKIVSLSLILCLSTGSLIFFIHPDNNAHDLPDEIEIIENNQQYENVIEFNQDTLQLQEEVIQYAITFHYDDIINVSASLFVSYVDETIVSSYFLLTDGKQPLLEPRFIWYAPERKYVLTAPHLRISLGRFLLIELLNRRFGKLQFGSSCQDTGHFPVRSGDTWYLTLAVPTSSEKSGFSIVFTSTTPSMEYHQLTKHKNIGMYVGSYNQFSGHYYSVKFTILGGFSLCDINKQLTTTTGSIIEFSVAGHRKGTMTVITPDGTKHELHEKPVIRYTHLGTDTGDWAFTFSGRSLYYRIGAVLLFIDVPPYVS